MMFWIVLGSIGLVAIFLVALAAIFAPPTWYEDIPPKEYSEEDY